MRSVRGLCAGAVILFLATYHLHDYPAPWFDEGSYMQVAKTLARFGVYADYSSEGFRYLGAPNGIGPTLIVPVAAAFRLFGVSLIAARLVVVAYLLAALVAFARLAHHLGGAALAWTVTALLVSSRAPFLLLHGRQALGDVPALFFLAAGLLVWLRHWDRASAVGLALAGVLLGLAAVTKHHYLLAIAPALALAWVTNAIYYRTASSAVFLIPLLLVLLCYAGWWGTHLLSIGPAAALEVVQSVGAAAHRLAGAGSPGSADRALRELVSSRAYLGWLLPALIYGVIRALPRQRAAQQWAVVLACALANLGWFATASVGLPRYALPGFALASLFVARLFLDLMGPTSDSARARGVLASPIRTTAAIVLALVVVAPLAQTVREMVWPPQYGTAAMAAYLNDHVARDVVVETWERELGLFTDHRYHYPPYWVLSAMTDHVWSAGPSPAGRYHALESDRPPYVVIGRFAAWAGIYTRDALSAHYARVTKIGEYELLARRQPVTVGGADE